MPTRVVPDGPEGRRAAIEVLRAGGIVAIPTDTVYGIAIALDAQDGVARLFEAKRRPPDRAIMLLIDDARQAGEVGMMGPAALALAAAGWPGGLTLVLPRRPGVALPAALTGGAPTIGVRLPDHPAPRALARGVGPLPTTSANLAGQPAATTADQVVDQLGDVVDLVLDGGPAPGGTASTVVDCSDDRPRLIRAGAISPGTLASVLDAAGLAHDLPHDLPPGAPGEGSGAVPGRPPGPTQRSSTPG